MNFNAMLNQGIGAIVKTLTRYYIKDRKGCSFIAHILPRIQKSAAIRNRYVELGTHIPPFLIASVTSQCNLHCSGCYARAGGVCGSGLAKTDLSAEKWQSIFSEAAQLGIPFILLAGGEPFVRRDVIETAAQNKDIVFPVFTNGTMLDESYLSLLDAHRNVIPVFSIEGDAAATDERRGAGVHAAVSAAMCRLREQGALFGASITVTAENLHTVVSTSFISELSNGGCGLVFFVEYVPVDANTTYLALSPKELRQLENAVSSLRAQIDDMVILSFPGDEAAMGGCLASGRGFFHINASGGAEPCPFAPHAKHNLHTSSILEVLQSDYFAELRNLAQKVDVHTGGCTLFAQEEAVLAIHAR